MHDKAKALLLAIEAIPRGCGAVHTVKISDDDLAVIDRALRNLANASAERTISGLEWSTLHAAAEAIKPLRAALEQLVEALWDADLEIEPSDHTVNVAYINAQRVLDMMPMRQRKTV